MVALGVIHLDQDIMFFDMGNDGLIFVWGLCLLWSKHLAIALACAPSVSPPILGKTW
jgi:hypothetical protein